MKQYIKLNNFQLIQRKIIKEYIFSVMNYGNTWDVFDMFSKIRMAIFRSLLELLERNRDTSQDDFSLHRSFPLKPTLTNLIEKTIKKLKSISNNNGYMLVAIVPRSEQAVIVDLIHEVILVLLNIIIIKFIIIIIKFISKSGLE